MFISSGSKRVKFKKMIDTFKDVENQPVKLEHSAS